MVHGSDHRHHRARNDIEPHGFGNAARQHHASMMAVIRDCDVLIAGMMGRGAHDQFQSAGIAVILTDEKFVQNVVQAYLDGTLINKFEERVH